MSRFHHRMCAIMLLAAGLVACSKETKASADSAGGVAAAAPTPRGIHVADNATVGRYISDPFGRALYTFSKDGNNSSACAEKCADDWMPYAEPQVATGSDSTFDRAKLGSITRGDGRTQITYAGKPLYFYTGDHAANEITGLAKKEFGGTWYLVAPSGDAIKSATVKTP